MPSEYIKKSRYEQDLEGFIFSASLFGVGREAGYLVHRWINYAKIDSHPPITDDNPETVAKGTAVFTELRNSILEAVQQSISALENKLSDPHKIRRRAGLSAHMINTSELNRAYLGAIELAIRKEEEKISYTKRELEELGEEDLNLRDDILYHAIMEGDEFYEGESVSLKKHLLENIKISEGKARDLVNYRKKMIRKIIRKKEPVFTIRTAMNLFNSGK